MRLLRNEFIDLDWILISLFPAILFLPLTKLFSGFFFPNRVVNLQARLPYSAKLVELCFTYLGVGIPDIFKRHVFFDLLQ